MKKMPYAKRTAQVELSPENFRIKIPYHIKPVNNFFPVKKNNSMLHLPSLFQIEEKILFSFFTRGLQTTVASGGLYTVHRLTANA
jgi:hypothetical protein